MSDYDYFKAGYDSWQEGNRAFSDGYKRNHNEVMYIAGPMEGYPGFNFPAFHAEAEALAAMGYGVLSPADPKDIALENPDQATDKRENFIRRDINMLLQADGVVVLPGWEMSRGARLEVSIARAMGLRIFERDGAWLVEVDYQTVLEEALTIAGGGSRQQQYGHPLFNFSRTAQMFSAILGIEVTPEQAALCMIGVKLARESFRPHRDNLVDIAGYSLVYEQIGRGREVLDKGGVLPNVLQNGRSEYPTT